MLTDIGANRLIDLWMGSVLGVELRRFVLFVDLAGSDLAEAERWRPCWFSSSPG